MGKHRGEDGKSTVTKDPFTNNLTNASEDNNSDISIRAKAVRPEDVEAVGGDTENQTSPAATDVITITAAAHRVTMKDMTALKMMMEGYIDNPSKDEQAAKMMMITL